MRSLLLSFPAATAVLVACTAVPPPSTLSACESDADCVQLGAGGMCMSNGCMLMDINAPLVSQAPPRAVDLSLPLLVDTDPDPAVFEASMRAVERDVELVAGTSTTSWVFLDDNGDGIARVPGPQIDVDAGTRIKVHFQNDLDVPTTIHWHGLVLPAQMDGPGIPGTEILPGAAFDYDFVARDASLYWFHPHLDGDEQIERGLYAPFVVRAGDEPVVDTERLLVLDDVLLDDAHQIVPPNRGSVMEADGKMSLEGMMGRQGNHLLVNGHENPILDVTPGTVERWRIVNVANARFFRLSIAGAQFVQIGSDGGLVSAPRTLDELLLAPGERDDVLVAFAGNGDVPLITSHYARGHDIADPGPLTVATLRFSPTPKDPPTPMPITSRPIATLPAAAVADKRIVMDERILRGGKVGFSLNDELFPDVTPLSAAAGSVETWDIVNDSGMDHPFHLHGAPFQVVSTQKKGGAVEDEQFVAWKDTVNVPAQTTLRFVVQYENPGTWMFHCHILEHAERGMMGMIEVNP